jgi:hypothetical protein
MITVIKILYTGCSKYLTKEDFNDNDETPAYLGLDLITATKGFIVDDSEV